MREQACFPTPAVMSRARRSPREAANPSHSSSPELFAKEPILAFGFAVLAGCGKTSRFRLNLASAGLFKGSVCGLFDLGVAADVASSAFRHTATAAHRASGCL